MTRKEKIAELIVVKLPLWKLFITLFVVFSVFIGVLFYIMENDSHFILASIIFGALISGGSTSLIGFGRKAIDFAEKAKSIEEMIRNGEDKDEILERLYALNKESFHITMSERVRELAKMAEIKYDIQLLKR